MKKLVLAALFVFLSVSTLSALVTESPIFVKSVNVLKVYPHELGYRVVYQKGDLSAGVIYVPHTWSRGDGDKVEYILGNGSGFPSISFFWENGELILVRLYLHESRQHRSWGTMDFDADMIAEFDNPVFEADF